VAEFTEAACSALSTAAIRSLINLPSWRMGLSVTSAEELEAEDSLQSELPSNALGGGLNCQSLQSSTIANYQRRAV
jgi:hypothetical protein